MINKSLTYRFTYALVPLNGGLNGRKLITGVSFYIFADFISKIKSQSVLYIDFMELALQAILAPTLYWLGASLMIVGFAHKIYKFLFPRELVGL